jgi:large subunit ribosomal protein L6
MSRIGKQPITVPAGVKVAFNGSTVNVEGPKGKLTRTFAGVTFSLEGNQVTVLRGGEDRAFGALHGTARAIVRNMVEGCATGYKKNLEIEGVGFKAILKGDSLDLALGYSHPILYKIPAGVKVTVTENVKIEVTGPDRHLVGQVAADIKHYYPVEPYKGKGVRIVGEFVRRKEGKKTA